MVLELNQMEKFQLIKTGITSAGLYIIRFGRERNHKI